MVRLDASLLRYLEEEDFRVLAAVELASRNHEIAPALLVERIAGLKAGGARKRLRWLLKHNFLLHECKVYDGYRMTYQTYDYLALRAFVKRGSITGVANKIGVGKESDIYVVGDDNDREMVLKIQRLGRTSFRTVKTNRDYKNGRALRGESWYYLSRLAAVKEFSFLKALHEEGFPVPEPIDQNRHCIVMGKVDGVPLTNVAELAHPEKVFKDSIDLIIKFAQYGLIHGDFNEFNLMITNEEKLVVIDFPQMTSTNHPNAQYLFNRDVECVCNFFRRKFKVQTDYRPTLNVDVSRQQSLDKKVHATGYNKQDCSVLDKLLDRDDEEDEETDEESEESENDDPETKEAPQLSEEVLKELSISTQPPEHDDGHEGEDEDAKPLLEPEDDDEEEEEEEEEEVKPWVRKTPRKATEIIPGCASTVTTKHIRRKVNPNFSISESGVSEINRDHLKNRVKGILRREDMHQVVKNCKRNSQKPADKRRTTRDINGARRDLRAEGML